MRHPWMAALALVALFACDSREPGIPEFTFTDSAGIGIATTRTGSAGSVPATELVETLRIGTVAGGEEYEFFHVQAALGLDDGSVVVADAGNRSVRVFDGAGRFVRSFGRPGDGPGELQGPYGLLENADTLVVLDRYVHRFRLTGEHLSSQEPAVPQRSFVWALARVGTGLVGELRAPPPMNVERGAPYDSPIMAVRLEPTLLAPVDTIVRIRGRTWYALGPVGFNLSPLFEPEPRIVFSESGIYAIPTGDYRIDHYDFDGRLARQIRAQVPLQPVTADLIAMFEASVEERLKQMPESSEKAPYREAQLELRVALDRPDVRPVLGRLLAAESGHLLVERLDLDPNPFGRDDPVTWDIMDPDGQLSGQFTADPTLVPLYLEDDGMWAVTQDDLDVQYVSRFLFRPTDPEAP